MVIVTPAYLISISTLLSTIFQWVRAAQTFSLNDDKVYGF